MEPKTKSSIANVLNRLEFSPDDCVRAAAENPLLFRDVIDYRIDKMRDRNAAKMQMEKIKAEIELAIRADARANGDKVTEGTIDAKLLVDPKVDKAIKLFNAAEEADEYSRLLLEAIRLRRDALKVIGDLVRDEVSLQRATEMNMGKVAEARERLKAKYPGR